MNTVNTGVYYNGLCGISPPDHDYAEYQEGWTDAMNGVNTNPYAWRPTDENTKEKLAKMLSWMYGYNAWIKLFGNGKQEVGWAYEV